MEYGRDRGDDDPKTKQSGCSNFCQTWERYQDHMIREDLIGSAGAGNASGWIQEAESNNVESSTPQAVSNTQTDVASQPLNAATSEVPSSPQPGPSGLQATFTEPIPFSPKDIKDLYRKLVQDPKQKEVLRNQYFKPEKGKKKLPSCIQKENARVRKRGTLMEAKEKIVFV
ncbi:hypothetical protein ILUMI_27525 [Ignelater luminosus]|uniref:Uncharacterized protein n=1 Tax=Ignelater luminosus TaxID=2038154 RepID=A0A8K0C3D7_IGNLU|nr:hypothetical protein ILUMI_27525 [Ignelater luminosus]